MAIDLTCLARYLHQVGVDSPSSLLRPSTSQSSGTQTKPEALCHYLIRIDQQGAKRVTHKLILSLGILCKAVCKFFSFPVFSS